MLNIDKILSQDRLLRATTGLNRKAFEHLLPRFKQVDHLSLQTSKPSRRRKIGAGRKSHLKTIKHKLFYILFYFKCYPTFDLASILFDMELIFRSRLKTISSNSSDLIICSFSLFRNNSIS